MWRGRPWTLPWMPAWRFGTTGSVRHGTDVEPYEAGRSVDILDIRSERPPDGLRRHVLEQIAKGTHDEGPLHEPRMWNTKTRFIDPLITEEQEIEVERPGPASFPPTSSKGRLDRQQTRHQGSRVQSRLTDRDRIEIRRMRRRFTERQHRIRSFETAATKATNARGRREHRQAHRHQRGTPPQIRTDAEGEGMPPPPAHASISQSSAVSTRSQRNRRICKVARTVRRRTSERSPGN